MMKNATMFNTCIPFYPSYPLKCVACEREHIGDINKAVDDGWYVTVYQTKSEGLVQFAGCPGHHEEQENASMAFIREKTK